LYIIRTAHLQHYQKRKNGQPSEIASQSDRTSDQMHPSTGNWFVKKPKSISPAKRSHD
jgi:hypothetical protein